MSHRTLLYAKVVSMSHRTLLYARVVCRLFSLFLFSLHAHYFHQGCFFDTVFKSLVGTEMNTMVQKLVKREESMCISIQAFFSSTFLLPVKGGKNSILNRVYKLNLFFVCFLKTFVVKIYENIKLQSQLSASTANHICL